MADEVLFAGFGSAVVAVDGRGVRQRRRLRRRGHHDRDRRRRGTRRQRRPGAGHRHVAAFVHAQPVPVADTKVTPAGSVSVTDSVAASDGPVFATTSE